MKINKPFPELRTSRYLLRQIVQSDIESVYAGLSDPRVYATCAVSYHSLEDTQVQMDWYSNLLEDEQGISWAICRNDPSREFLGVCGFSSHLPEHRRAEIGYWMLHQHWGKGIASECVEAIVRYGFEKLNLHRIGAQVDIGNVASSRLLERLGFSYEGTSRGCELKDGAFIDLKNYSKLASDCQ